MNRKPPGLKAFADFQRKEEKRLKQEALDVHEFIQELPIEERKEYSEMYKAWKHIRSLGERHE